MSSQETLFTDVLIIGSGLAGLRAAEAASNEGASVIVVGKGVGASPGIMGFDVAINREDSKEVYYNDLLRSGCHINNKKLARILAEDSIEEVANLERLGLKFDKLPDGRYDAFQPLGSSHPRLVHHKALTGIKGLSLIGKDCRKRGVVFKKKIMLTKLLQDRGKVIGAVGIDLSSGAFVSFLAKATILTTGGCGAIYPITTYPKDIVGDGYAMAYRAGAELVDVEFLQFDPCCFVYPESIKGKPIATTMMKEGAVLLNVHGKRFMLKYGKQAENVQKDELSRAMAMEIAEGGGTKHGGVYYDVTMLPRDMVVINHSILRSRLESEHKRLTEELDKLLEAGRPKEERREGSPFGKREEEAAEAAELETRLEMEKRIKGQLAAVEHALEKFDKGTYGLCDSCGQPIEAARLEALPYASVCMKCKAKDAKPK